jgi:hypothetical protein
MKHLGEYIGHFTVKNDDEVDLFKVHFYEKGISFDDKFLRGVIENEDTYKKFMKINSDWKESSDRESTMKSIMSLLEGHQDYLSDFFISEDDVDSNDIPNTNEMFLQHLKENDKLTEITRKDFESKITDEKIGNFYVDNLKQTKESSKFYTYNSDNSGMDFFIMVVDDKIKIGFADK